MSTSTTFISPRNNSGPKTPKREGITLSSILAVLFAVKLRESLDAETSGDRSDAAWTWGL